MSIGFVCTSGVTADAACYDLGMDDEIQKGAAGPIPLFAAASNMAEQSPLQDDAAPVQVHEGAPQVQEAASNSADEFTVPVPEILSRLFSVGIEKSDDSIQRYCRQGHLNCHKQGMFRRYYATENSVAALIEKLKKDEPEGENSDLHEAARTGMQVHEGAQENKTVEDLETHQPARTRMQVDEDEGETIVDFLKEQIRVKDDQIQASHEQIAAMLERDRETNILIQGLQASLTNTVGLLTGGRDGRGGGTVRNVESQKQQSNNDVVDNEGRDQNTSRV